MLASPHFKRTFQKGFQEGNELQSTGYVKITTHDWKPLPFLLLMAILHGQSQLVPRKLPLRRLTEMAILVDYYECYEAVAMFADLWTEGIEERQQKLSMGNAIKWLCIAWVFRQNRAFKDITRHLQLESKERVTPNGLPIPTNLIDTLQKSREMSIGKVIDSLHELLERLRHGPQQCGFGCDIMRLGALAKGMDELEILSPKPEAPFSGYSFMSLMAGCYEIDKSYTYDSCRLMSDVLEMVGNEFPLLDAGFSLESFSSLRTKA
ncbi:hypothetical protein ETB97_012473 [Aspergillus alliaceus]|nr:hypothetical protein ETB97_012473 [Aspergillus burnettii]